jgi:hypothetical protein
VAGLVRNSIYPINVIEIFIPISRIVRDVEIIAPVSIIAT